MSTLKTITFNVNGIQTRLAVLLAWLEREAPDIVYLQELKIPDARFPAAALERAGCSVIWQGQSVRNGAAVLAHDSQPLGARRDLLSNASDPHSRYLEATADDLPVTSLYLPNGNPQPGSKLDHKLAWFEHLICHAAEPMGSGHPVVLTGNSDVIPSGFDIYDTRSWEEDALLQPRSRECFERPLRQGWVDTLRQRFSDRRIYTFRDYLHQHWQRDTGLRIDRLLSNASLAGHPEDVGVGHWVRGEEHTSDHASAWISPCLN